VRQIFNIYNPFMRFLGKVLDLLILDILWLVCSLTIVTMGAATTALYHSCFKIIKDEEGSVFLMFFKAFKNNFKHATIIWLIFLVLGAFLAFDFAAATHLSNENMMSGSIFFGIFALLAVVLALMLIYTFALLSRFSNTVKRTMTNALMLGISHLGRTVLMVLIDLVVVYFSIFYLPFAIPVAPIVVNCFFLEGVFKAHQPAEEPAE